ncbi:hypothetical protein PENTCL1PPCAC_3400, partial [Pristionchus entomophagus]
SPSSAPTSYITLPISARRHGILRFLRALRCRRSRRRLQARHAQPVPASASPSCPGRGRPQDRQDPKQRSGQGAVIELFSSPIASSSPLSLTR